jgi:hypothetical protein
MLLAILSVAVVVGLVARQLPGTDAAFTDRVVSGANTVGAGNLQPPVLTASVSGTTVNLSWTNPDGLTGGSSSFIVQRASGACTSPGTFSAISGSPFAITTLSTTNSPAAGTYCYAIQSKYHNWLSPFGTSASVNQKTVTVSAPISGLGLSDQSSGSCGGLTLGGTSSSSSIGLNSGAGGNIFVAPASLGLTQIHSGTHTLTLKRTSSGGNANATVSATIGYCENGTFTGLASSSSVSITFDQTVNLTMNVGTTVALSPTRLLAVQINVQPAINIVASASSLSAPPGYPYKP